jgi:cytochrome c oxidase cbb3-type subunit 3
MSLARIFYASLLSTAGLFGVAAAEREGANERIEEQQLIIPLVPLAPGPEGPVQQIPEAVEKYEGNPEMIAAGKQLYSAMNCVGCHANGGGGMGPPLMDSTWIYGSSLAHIFSSIREGRPNGMPSFRGRILDEQIWQLAAFVKSLSNDKQATSD